MRLVDNLAVVEAVNDALGKVANVELLVAAMEKKFLDGVKELHDQNQPVIVAAGLKREIRSSLLPVGVINLDFNRLHLAKKVDVLL